MEKYNSIVVLGPTASGKTSLACSIAFQFNGEVISADSRQVYRGLDIGTGKDLNEYEVNGHKIPFHLIDIADAEKQFFLHEYQHMLHEAFADIRQRNKLPVICGGTGMYLDALRKDYSFTQVPEDPLLRAELGSKNKQELIDELRSYPSDHIRHVDTTSVKRIIRGIEIARYLSRNTIRPAAQQLPFVPFYIGISSGKEEREKKIKERLDKRLQDGLLEEVRSLLSKGVSHHRLEFLGLEYKFISEHLSGKTSFEQMRTSLAAAISQYAKRQMTWFRKMEKENVNIHWIDPIADREILFKDLSELFVSPSSKQ